MRKPLPSATTRTHGDGEFLGEVRSYFFSELFGASGKDIDILRHAGFVDVGVDGLSAKEDGVVAVAQEFEDRVLHFRERVRFFYCELPETE